MKEKTSALFSEYVIDGVRQGLTPARMLLSCAADGALTIPDERFEPVVDETVDVSPAGFEYDPEETAVYLEKTLSATEVRRCVPAPFAASFTCGKVAQALLDVIWRNGHFRLDDLSLRAEWRWDGRPIGRMAAFYASVEAVCEYIDLLGLTLKYISYSPAKECTVSFKAGMSGIEDDDEWSEDPQAVRIGRRRLCPATLQDDPEAWIVYIPFDSCAYRLGGSALSEALDARSPVAPDIRDGDYFIDCYEVVRELVEDGIVRAGAAVGEGGLLTALKRMCTPETGASISIADLRNAYAGTDSVRLLFAEVPGVLIQIDDADYDYLDAELLLQDVAYFPLGHPVRGGQLTVDTVGKSGVQGILESLLNSQASEGED